MILIVTHSKDNQSVARVVEALAAQGGIAYHFGSDRRFPPTSTGGPRSAAEVDDPLLAWTTPTGSELPYRPCGIGASRSDSAFPRRWNPSCGALRSTSREQRCTG